MSAETAFLNIFLSTVAIILSFLSNMDKSLSNAAIVVMHFKDSNFSYIQTLPFTDNIFVVIYGIGIHRS